MNIQMKIKNKYLRRRRNAVHSRFLLSTYIPAVRHVEPQTEYVKAYENAHLKRRDHLWKLLEFALLTVYWFNPLCRLAYALCRDIEFACDERVIQDYCLSACVRRGRCEKEDKTGAEL